MELLGGKNEFEVWGSNVEIFHQQEQQVQYMWGWYHFFLATIYLSLAITVSMNLFGNNCNKFFSQASRGHMGVSQIQLHILPTWVHISSFCSLPLSLMSFL